MDITIAVEIIMDILIGSVVLGYAGFVSGRKKKPAILIFAIAGWLVYCSVKAFILMGGFL